MMRFWNHLQSRKIAKPNNLKIIGSKKKQIKVLNRIAKINHGHICLWDEILSLMCYGYRVCFYLPGGSRD